MTEIKPMTMLDLSYVLNNLRQKDLIELLDHHYQGNMLGNAYMRFRVDGKNEAYTGYSNGIPVYVFGILELNPHIAHSWAFATDDAIKVFKTSLKFHRTMLDQKKYSRISTTTPAYRTESHRMLEMMGYEKEGILRNFGKSGSDYLSYYYGGK